MNAISPLAVTADTVTLRRTDFETMLEAVEDAEDIAALAATRAREDRLGKEAARADYLPAEAVERLIEGVHPLRVWREQRGLTVQALSDKAGMTRSYVSEIEGRRKPGSVAAFQRLARALGVMVDDLVG